MQSLTTYIKNPELMDSQVIDLGRRGGLLRFGRRGHFVDSATGQRQRFRRGQQHRYNEADSPLRLAAYVQYGYVDMERGAESHAAVFHAGDSRPNAVQATLITTHRIPPRAAIVSASDRMLG